MYTTCFTGSTAIPCGCHPTLIFLISVNVFKSITLIEPRIALSTIASISTMVGLLGTVVGMIRSFAALGHTGAVDATKLAVGISEALINTAGGLIVAIIGIVMYNVFVTRVDGFNYMMDEASYEAVQLLAANASDKK